MASSGDVIAEPSDAAEAAAAEPSAAGAAAAWTPPPAPVPAATTTTSTTKSAAATAAAVDEPTAAAKLRSALVASLARHRIGARNGSAAPKLRVLQEADFTNDLVGAKAMNLRALRQRLPAWVIVPRSVALPYGSLEAVLAHPANAAAAARLAQLQTALAAAADATQHGSGSGSSSSSNGSGNGSAAGRDAARSLAAALEEARSIVAHDLVPPPGLQKDMFDALVLAGLLPGGGGAGVEGTLHGHTNGGHAKNGHTNGHGNGNGNGHHGNGPTTNGNGNGHSSNGHSPISIQQAAPVSASQPSLSPAPTVTAERPPALTAESGPVWSPADPDCPVWAATWAAVCGVWASKYNMRAWLARRAAGQAEDGLRVSVLLQQVCVCVLVCGRGRGGRWYPW